MSNILRAVSGTQSKKRLIVALETLFRCAREPKQTVCVLRASTSISDVKGILSQATFSQISYCGIPFPDNVTWTVPVAKGVVSIRYFSFLLLRQFTISDPNSSLPIALAAYPSNPNCDT